MSIGRLRVRERGGRNGDCRKSKIGDMKALSSNEVIREGSCTSHGKMENETAIEDRTGLSMNEVRAEAKARWRRLWVGDRPCVVGIKLRLLSPSP